MSAAYLPLINHSHTAQGWGRPFWHALFFPAHLHLQAALQHLPVRPGTRHASIFRASHLLLAASCVILERMAYSQGRAGPNLSSSRGHQTFTFWKITNPQTVPSANGAEYYPWEAEGEDCKRRLESLQMRLSHSCSIWRNKRLLGRGIWKDVVGSVCVFQTLQWTARHGSIYMMLNCAFFVNKWFFYTYIYIAYLFIYFLCSCCVTRLGGGGVLAAIHLLLFKAFTVH